jgi:CBS-domain-containing membrane protein
MAALQNCGPRPMFRVSDVMTREVVAVGPDTPVPRLVETFLSTRLHNLPVVSASGEPLGYVSVESLVKRLAPPTHLLDELMRGDVYQALDRFREEARLTHGLTAADIMQRWPVHVEEDTLAPVAAAHLVDHNLNSLPVLREGKLVGIVTLLDMIRCLSQPRPE